MICHERSGPMKRAASRIRALRPFVTAALCLLLSCTSAYMTVTSPVYGLEQVTVHGQLIHGQVMEVQPPAACAVRPAEASC